MPQTTLSIPTTIHAVWLGKIPPSEVLDNINHWKQTNPTFTTNLWIDSSTYTEEEKSEKFPKLLEWAKQNHTLICDISLPAEDSKDNLIGEQALYSKMPGKQFYDDEITGQFRNLAAASDILRAEILYEKGGFYIDGKDMLPNQSIPLNFALKFGFAFHDCGNGELNNDLMASIPKGTIISEYRQQIIDNYKILYDDKRLVDSHRNKNLRNPQLLSGGDPRYLTTLRTSGPVALSSIVEHLMHFLVPIPEADSPIYDVDESALFMPNEIFSIPKHGSDVSWNDFDISYEKIKPYLFNYVCEYWSLKILEEIASIDQIISNSSSGLSFLTNFFRKVDPELYDIRKMLVVIKNRLENLPRSLSPDDFFQLCVSNLDKKTMEVLENMHPDFWTKFQYSFSSFNSRLSLCEKEIADKDFHHTILHVSAMGVEPGWQDFIALFIGLREAPEDISHLRELVQVVGNKNFSSFRQI